MRHLFSHPGIIPRDLPLNVGHECPNPHCSCHDPACIYMLQVRFSPDVLTRCSPVLFWEGVSPEESSPPCPLLSCSLFLPFLTLSLSPTSWCGGLLRCPGQTALNLKVRCGIRVCTPSEQLPRTHSFPLPAPAPGPNRTYRPLGASPILYTHHDLHWGSKTVWKRGLFSPFFAEAIETQRGGKPTGTLNRHMCVLESKQTP